jgi:hypothetical protein
MQQQEAFASPDNAAAAAAAARPLSRNFHRRRPSLSSHQTTDISKHYAINNQILAAFDNSLNNSQQHTGTNHEHANPNNASPNYQVAYAMGLQFVETALLEIPKHGYYYSTRHETARMQSALEAVRVTQLLVDIQEQADAEIDSAGTNTNTGNNMASRERVQKLADLAMEQVEQASHDQYNESLTQSQRGQRNRDRHKRKMHEGSVPTARRTSPMSAAAIMHSLGCLRLQ